MLAGKNFEAHDGDDEDARKEHARALIEEICAYLKKGDSPASLQQIIEKVKNKFLDAWRPLLQNALDAFMDEFNSRVADVDGIEERAGYNTKKAGLQAITKKALTNCILDLSAALKPEVNAELFGQGAGFAENFINVAQQKFDEFLKFPYTQARIESDEIKKFILNESLESGRATGDAMRGAQVMKSLYQYFIQRAHQELEQNGEAIYTASNPPDKSIPELLRAAIEREPPKNPQFFALHALYGDVWRLQMDYVFFSSGDTFTMPDDLMALQNDFFRFMESLSKGETVIGIQDSLGARLNSAIDAYAHDESVPEDIFPYFIKELLTDIQIELTNGCTQGEKNKEHAHLYLARLCGLAEVVRESLREWSERKLKRKRQE